MIRVSGYTYFRNGLKMGYPILESIKSALPIVDDYVVVLGDSEDGSREAVESLRSPKIRIVDVVWDMNLRTGGRLFAQQSNLGLDHVAGDWILHLQADEVIHENDATKLRNYMETFHDQPRVEGLLFPFLNFRGDYNHIHTGRMAHRFEIRAFRHNPLIRSYKDSQGFRKYSSVQAYGQGERGTKLAVMKIDVPVYHYSYVRPPKLMLEKTWAFHSMYQNDQWLKTKLGGLQAFDYNEVDRLDRFTGSHPKVMHDIISKQDWTFTYDPSRFKPVLRHRLLNRLEEITGYRIGEYKNYKLLN